MHADTHTNTNTNTHTQYSLGLWIIFRPYPLKLIKMIWAQNGPITGKIVTVVHDDSHKQVNDLKKRYTKKLTAKLF